MSSTEEKPEVVVYRVQLLEGKVDSLIERFDKFHTEFSGRMCAAPSTCLKLAEIVTRLDKAQEEDRQRLLKAEENHASIRKEIDDRSNFVRGAVWVAGIVGTILGMVGPAVVAAAKAHFVKS